MFGSISLLNYSDPDNYMYYGIAASVLLLIVGIIMNKRGTFDKIKKVIQKKNLAELSLYSENDPLCKKRLQPYG